MRPYVTGMDQLLERPDCDELLKGRVGLVCHPASVNGGRQHSATLLRDRLGDRLRCLLGPEHGFWGHAGPGIAVHDAVHPDWEIPIYSLYGDTGPAMKALAHEVDVLVVDLQDLGVRCYTYIHTLRQMLEGAARLGVRVIVTDRAIPWACCVDGPMLETAFQSTVAPVNVPFVYGMTPGETAGWMRDFLDLELDLTVVPAVYDRTMTATDCWPEWVPPSPAIRSWACAVCFPITVFTEALPQIDCARDTEWAFQILRADWLQAEALIEALQLDPLPGVRYSMNSPLEEAGHEAVFIEVLDTCACHPASTALFLLRALTNVHGVGPIWEGAGARPVWFDSLMGTDQVRCDLQSERPLALMATAWRDAQAGFRAQRAAHLLYPEIPCQPTR